MAKGGKKAADATKLAAHEVTNLSYQMNDIAMMLASGQSPFMVMMQQGMQVSQIMGQRGLGTVLPSLAGGLASLVNPTMLALAAITALGYGAGAVFSSLRGDVKTADEALADHEAAIKALKEAWGEAGKGLKDYLAESASVALFRATGSTRALRSTLEREVRSAMDTLSYYTWSGDAATGYVTGDFHVREKFAPFKAAIEELKQSIDDGAPGVQAFVDKIVAIANADPANQTLQRLAQEILDATANADELSRALPAAEAAIDGTAAAAERAAGLIEAYGNALERLSKAQSAEEARAAANAASHHAQTLGEALKAAEELDRKLMEIGGRGAPIPTPAPNREEVFAERDAHLAQRSRELTRISDTYDRLAGSIDAAKAKAELELALIGASTEQRNRAAAAIEAETIIRQLGIDAMGAEAEALRRQGSELADLRTEVEKAADAWNTVKSAGESAIDGLVDKLASGDVKGAIEGLTRDITKMTLQLGLANPLKNFLFGGDNPTFADLRQGGGFVGRLLGGAGGQGAIDAAVGRVAATMHVTAATVIVNGGIGGGVSGGLGSVLGGPGGAAGAVNDNSVAGQIWNFFAGKGLAPHQVAGILGNVAQESAFNPFAIGDGGSSFGLLQAHAGRARALLDFIGGKGNLGDVGKQLDFMWKELQGPENASLKRLLASSNVREATAAFAGYERPKGWSVDNPEASHGYVNRLRQAELALDRFGSKAAPAADAVSALGKDATSTASTLAGSASSLDAAGKAMRLAAMAFPQAPSAPGGGLLSSFLRRSISAGALAAIGGHGPAVGLFDAGGFTGAGNPKDVAGLVHRREYVFDAVSTARIGPENLDALRRGALRGYETGGYVGAATGALPASAAAPATIVQIIDNAGVAKRTERERGANGETVTRLILSRVGAEIAGGGYDSQMKRFGSTPTPVVRAG